MSFNKNIILTVVKFKTFYYLCFNINEKEMFVARKSNHIQEDIKRNWSSWNFGQEGFSGTEEEFNSFLEKATEDNSIWLSGFDLYIDDVKRMKFAELYKGYWVAVDIVNARNGLSCITLDSDTLEDAIKESEKGLYFGDGDSFDASEATLVYSNNDIHIFEIED